MEIQNHQKANKMAVVSPYISIITLNINQLNLPKKSGWIDTCCLQESGFNSKDTQAQSEGNFPCKWRPKESRHSHT